jgi:hypothetical protein
VCIGKRHTIIEEEQRLFVAGEQTEIMGRKTIWWMPSAQARLSGVNAKTNL